MRIFDETLTRVERSLDVRLQRHGVLAGNLANIDTPAYKPRDVDFVAAMGAAFEGQGVNRTDARHFDAQGGSLAVGVGGTTAGDAGPAPVVEVTGSTPSLDGNGVDLDQTMAALAENGLQYGANARAASKKLGILRYVASDGVG